MYIGVRCTHFVDLQCLLNIAFLGFTRVLYEQRYHSSPFMVESVLKNKVIFILEKYIMQAFFLA